MVFQENRNGFKRRPTSPKVANFILEWGETREADGARWLISPDCSGQGRANIVGVERVHWPGNVWLGCGAVVLAV